MPSGPFSPDAGDDAFLSAFEAGRIANHQFHHGDHLRLAWLRVNRLGPELATGAMTADIRRFAASHGHSDRYNDTMTRFWVHAVALAVGQHPGQPFPELLAAEPHLLDKNLPYRHWSRELLVSSEAKAEWVDPDLLPLPPLT